MITNQIVNSSMISHVTYDTENHGLIITFKKGDKYLYFDVPNEVYNNFINSTSIGKFYLNNIKGYYNSKKL